MSNRVNFQDFLLQNEKLLGIGKEANGNHPVDGKLDDSEISIFFSSSNIEMNDSDGEAILSEEEFNKWYESNESTINAYYDSIDVEADEDSKKSMLQSMIDFISANADNIPKEQGVNSDTLGDINLSDEETIEKFGQEYIDGAKEALKQWDYDSNGETSAEEMSQSISKTYSNVFKGNEAFSELAQEIAKAQGEIYTKYAGDDGILNEYEYSNALNSDENNLLLDQYWELKDTQEALNGETDIAGLQRHDRNGDGKINPLEVYKNKVEMYEKVFAGDEKKIREAKKIALDQAILLNKQARENGHLSSEAYAKALSSDDYIKKTEEYLTLRGINTPINKMDILNIQYEKQLQDLYDELSKAESPQERDAINAKIMQLKLEKSKSDMNETVNSIEDIDDSQKKEILDLFSELSSTKTDEDKDAIYAKIQQKFAEYNIPKSVFLQLDTIATQINQAETMTDLYAQLSEAKGTEQHDAIASEMALQDAMFTQNLKEMIDSSYLSDDIKSELESLYSDLSKAEYQDQKDSISAKIKQLCMENNIPESLTSGLDLQALKISNSAQITELYAQLSQAKGESQKDSIWARINQLENLHQKEESKLIIKNTISNSGLNMEQQSEIKDLYAQLSEAKSTSERDSISAQIKQKLEEFNAPETTSTDLNIESLKMIMDAELSELYEALSQATTTNTRDRINAQIKQKTEEYNNELQALYEKSRSFIEDI